MGIITQRYVSEFEGHTIELVRNALAKTLTLRIDGRPVARASVALPRDIILTGTLEHHGMRHTVTATSLVHLWSLSRNVSIAVDGVTLPGIAAQ
jgi:hypothetical protein